MCLSTIEAIFISIDENSSDQEKLFSLSDQPLKSKSTPSTRYQPIRSSNSYNSRPSNGNMRNNNQTSSYPRSFQSNNRRPVTCFNCGKLGHSYQVCHQPRNQTKISDNFNRLKIPTQQRNNNNNYNRGGRPPMNNKHNTSTPTAPTHRQYESLHQTQTTPDDHTSFPGEYTCAITALSSTNNVSEAIFNTIIPTHKASPQKGSPDDIRCYLMDSGASSHFTPHLEDLKDPVDCNIKVMLSDSSRVKDTQQGSINLKLTSDQGIPCTLTLKRVLYVPGLNMRLFSIPAYIRDTLYTVKFGNNFTQLCFGDGQTYKLPSPINNLLATNTVYANVSTRSASKSTPSDEPL